MILITGAGGKTGKILTHALSNMESVCAFVHREDHVALLKSLGAKKVILGDMKDEALIGSAMQGVRAVYHICPNMNPDETVIGRLVINAARESGVEHFVYHSVLHPQTEKMTHHWQKLRTEEILLESGLAFTILQPAPYMQNLLAGWKEILEEGILRVPYSVDSKFSFVDLKDIAEAATVVLSQSGHTFATYELASTQPMSHVEVANTFGRALQRDVRAEREEIGDWRVRVGGIHKYAAQNLERMFEYYNRWGCVGNPNVIRWILGKESTTLESFVQRTLNERDAIR